jgi:hypothetical protein
MTNCHKPAPHTERVRASEKFEMDVEDERRTRFCRSIRNVALPHNHGLPADSAWIMVILASHSAWPHAQAGCRSLRYQPPLWRVGTTLASFRKETPSTRNGQRVAALRMEVSHGHK